MGFSRQQKAEIIGGAHERLRAEKDKFPLEVACLHYAAVIAIAISQRGVRPVLQAGGASWRFKAAALDDGGPTNYTYEFNPGDPLSAARLAAGGLPEIHCWVGIPSTGELVDPTTGFLPELLRTALPDEKWTEPPPPTFFWGKGTELPPGWSYNASMEAIRIAFDCLKRSRPDLWSDMQRRGLTPPRT